MYKGLFRLFLLIEFLSSSRNVPPTMICMCKPAARTPERHPGCILVSQHTAKNFISCENPDHEVEIL